jgi:hypothetical protein
MVTNKTRYFGLILSGTAVTPIYSEQEISFTPQEGQTFIVTDLNLWDFPDENWCYRLVGKTEVHVAPSDEQFSVRVMSGGMDDAHPGYYDTFEEAIVRGQMEVDRLEQERELPVEP